MKRNAYFYTLVYMVLPLVALFLLTGTLKLPTGESILSAGNIALIALALISVAAAVTLLKYKTVGYVLTQIIFGMGVFLFLGGFALAFSGDEFLNDPEIKPYLPALALLALAWICAFIYNFISRKRYLKDKVREATGVEVVEAQVEKVTEMTEAPGEKVAETTEVPGEEVPVEQVSPKREPGKFAYVIRSLILVAGVLMAVSLLRYCAREFRDFFVSLATAGKTVTAFKKDKIDTIAECLYELSWVGMAFWLSWVMKKAGFLTKEEQGFSKNKKPLKSMLMGMAVAVIFTVGFVIMLYVQGCEVARNNITARYMLKIVCGILCQLGVAFIEEIQFRGFALGYCRKHGVPVWGAVMSIIVFVGIHFDSFGTVTAVRVMYLLPLAILLTALRLYRQSTWTSIGYHFMYNVMVTRVVETTRGGRIESFFRTMKITNWKFTIGIMVPTLILAVVVFTKMIVRAKRGQIDET